MCIVLRIYYSFNESLQLQQLQSCNYIISSWKSLKSLQPLYKNFNIKLRQLEAKPSRITLDCNVSFSIQTPWVFCKVALWLHDLCLEGLTMFWSLYLGPVFILLNLILKFFCIEDLKFGRRRSINVHFNKDDNIHKSEALKWYD